MVTTLLCLWLILLAPCIEGGERNTQHFVKIDVAKINIKNTTDSIENVSSTTLTSESVTESSTKPSTTEFSTTTASSPTTSKSTATETTVTAESTTATITSTATPTLDPTDASYPSFKVGRAAKLVPKGYYCRCDLTINVCDINCCCDIDCNAAILRTYNCDQEQLHPDEYHHGEGLQSCRVQGGLFCLVEPIYEEGDDSYYNPDKLSSATRHKWKEVFPLENPAAEDIRFDHYRVDDVIYVYNETSEMVQLFALPASLAGSVCQIEQPVRFLQDRTTLCQRTVDELSEFNRAFIRHTSQSVRFFRTPKKSTVMEHYCVEEGDCLNATISLCYYSAGSGWNCSLGIANITDAIASVDEPIEEDFASTVCRELEILFIHNYTNLQQVQMKLLCRPASPERNSDGELWLEKLWQRIIVKFKIPSAHSNTDLARAVSGNIGYLIGKPLIVSHLEMVANRTISAEESPSENPPTRMLAYFTNETRLPDASFRLRIPISRRNHCELTDEYHQTIDFGTDMFHRCNYIPPNVTNQTTGGVQNYTKFCQDLQAGLYAQLLHGIYPDISLSRAEGYDKLNLYVSKYGNPINRTTDWVRVRSTNVILEAEPGSDSSPNTDTTDSYFTCNNMLINVEYRYYYARTRVRDVRHQAIVHDAEIVFGPRVNLRFRLDEEIRVPIFIQVQFFDLTSSSVAAVGEFSELLIRFGVLFYVFSTKKYLQGIFVSKPLTLC